MKKLSKIEHEMHPSKYVNGDKALWTAAEPRTCPWDEMINKRKSETQRRAPLPSPPLPRLWVTIDKAYNYIVQQPNRHSEAFGLLYLQSQL